MNQLINTEKQDLSYPNLEKQALAFIDSVKSGVTNPLELMILLKAVSTMTKIVEDSIKDLAIDEARNFHKDDSKMMGAKFQLKSTAAKYDFDSDVELKKYKEMTKERTKVLKEAIKSVGQVIYNDEVVEPPKMISPSSTTISITFK